MYYSLKGTLIHHDAYLAVVECAGVGYRCLTTMHTLSALPQTGGQVTLFTHLNVREDALDLYGFATLNECEAFKRLIAVNGVGPKSALAILSDLTPDKLAICIAGGDTKTLCRAPGIGPKAAQRIILELKDKMRSEDFTPQMQQTVQGLQNEDSPLSEAVSALCALGYARGEAAAALAGAPSDVSTQDLIKLGLKKLSSAR